MATKLCKVCGQELPLSQFPTNRGRKDGHLDTCFECWAIMTTDKMRVLAVVERKQRKAEEVLKPEVEPKVKLDKKQGTRVKLTNEERKQRLKEYSRRYCDAHREEIRKRNREAYHRCMADPERAAHRKAKEREYREAHRERRREIQRAYYKRKKQKNTSESLVKSK